MASKKRIRILFSTLILYFLVSCSNPINRINFQPTPDLSGTYLINLTDEYFNIGRIINVRIAERNFEEIKNLLREMVIVVGKIKNQPVSPKYGNAKKLLGEALWLDSFSILMMIEGMPKEDYESTFFDGAAKYAEYVSEMRTLGHQP